MEFGQWCAIQSQDVSQMYLTSQTRITDMNAELAASKNVSIVINSGMGRIGSELMSQILKKKTPTCHSVSRHSRSHHLLAHTYLPSSTQPRRQMKRV